MALFDAFLELKGVEGESTDSKMKGKIEVDSFSCSAQQTGTQHHGGGGGAGKVKISDWHFTKHYDKSSVLLWLSCCTGTHYEQAILTCRKAGGEQESYLKIKLKDVLISSYNIGGHSKGDLPIMDEFTLNVGSIKRSTRPRPPKARPRRPGQGRLGPQDQRQDITRKPARGAGTPGRPWPPRSSRPERRFPFDKSVRIRESSMSSTARIKLTGNVGGNDFSSFVDLGGGLVDANWWLGTNLGTGRGQCWATTRIATPSC